jgi:hypothetical protein
MLSRHVERTFPNLGKIVIRFVYSKCMLSTQLIQEFANRRGIVRVYFNIFDAELHEVALQMFRQPIAN